MFSKLLCALYRRLAGQIDLEAVDAAGIVGGLQLLDAVAQAGDVGVLVADDLCALQQADVAARLLRAGAAGKAAPCCCRSRAAERRRRWPKPPPPTPLNPSRPLPPKNTAAAVRALPRSRPGHDVQVKAAAVALHLPHVGQQRALGDRQAAPSRACGRQRAAAAARS